MKHSFDEIEQVVNDLASSLMYAKQAHRVAKKVYGDEKEISQLLKYCYADLQKAIKVLEGE